jgi:hypothetical protein
MQGTLPISLDLDGGRETHLLMAAIVKEIEAFGISAVPSHAGRPRVLQDAAYLSHATLQL